MRSNHPAQSQLVSTYGMSRTAIYQLRRRLDLESADLVNPDLVFQKMLDNGRSSKLRTMLANPTTREKIRAKLSTNTN